METHRDGADLSAELRALRPVPLDGFTQTLDARLAAGFPKANRASAGLRGRLAGMLHTISPRRLALPASAVALAAFAIAIAVIAIDHPRHSVPARNRSVAASEAAQEASLGGHPSTQFSDPAPTGRASGAAARESSTGTQYSAAPTFLASSAGRRDVERGAELVLHSEPDEIDRDAKEVFAVVHSAHGIVLSSSIHDWASGPGNPRAAEAQAAFELLVPTARLGNTLASLSGIANVRSRHQSTLDITAPTVGVGERLDDSRARIDGLLAQLANAESDSERAEVETELRGERRHVAALGSTLDRLRRRAHFARVSLQIESGNPSTAPGAGSWGLGDGLDDAGRVLAIAAGVAVIALAAVGPLVLIGLLAWRGHRVWAHRRRESVSTERRPR
jgi:hypothetical protein